MSRKALHRRLNRVTPPAVLAAMVFVAGCGGSSHGHTATGAAGASATTEASAPARTSTSGASRTPSSPAAAKRRHPRHKSSKVFVAARTTGARALLRLNDLPSGFIAGPRIGGPARITRRLAPCLHVGVSGLEVRARREVLSPKYRSGAHLVISNSVSVLPSEAEAKRQFALLAQPQAPACAARVLARSLARGLSTAPRAIDVGAASARRIAFPQAAQQTTAIRVQVSVGAKATRANETFDVVALRSGPALAFVGFGSAAQTQVASSLERHLVSLTATRLRAALASG